MFARAAGLTLVHTYLLGFEHWVTRELRDLDVEDIEVVAVEPGAEERFDGIFICEKVRLCDRLEIRHGTDVVTISDDALFHDEVILCPAGCRGGALSSSRSRPTPANTTTSTTRPVTRTCAGSISWCAPCAVRIPASMLRCLLQDLPLNDYATLIGTDLPGLARRRQPMKPRSTWSPDLIDLTKELPPRWFFPERGPRPAPERTVSPQVADPPGAIGAKSAQASPLPSLQGSATRSLPVHERRSRKLARK
jgi:hypothetical protein